jgi:ABC-type lipoprotein export system ATPase subunit
MSNFPKGSVWRRWDLHVHTPSSIVQEYGGDTPQAWDAFIAAIKALPKDVAVLGITDYLFVDGYEKLLKHRAEIPTIQAIFPNIEFRLNTFSGTASNQRRHNFHVIFDPCVTPQTIREQLLNCLSTAYRIEDRSKWQRTPTVTSLEELGVMIKKAAPAGNTVHSKSNLQVGFDNITYDRDDILENLRKDCFRGKYIIAIGYSEWDQARWDQSAAEKRDLINEASFSLISNDDIDAIDGHISDLKHNKLNSLILHSSDSHSLARLGQTKLWIKGDPTFAGLKQVVNEPSRIFLGDAPPRFKQAHQIISKITIPSSAGWFATPFELELNDGLVAVIGGRGSGKSALAEMIASGAGARDPSDDSFINKAVKHASTIRGSQAELTWADDATTSGTAAGDEADLGLVKYLPQRAVEELCSPENSETLISQIESVIFQALDETARLGASDFSELKASVLRSYDFEKDQIASALEELNQQMFTVETAIKQLPLKQRELDAKKADLKKLQDTLPKLPTADQKAQNELALLIAQKGVFEAKIIALRKVNDQITELLSRVRVFEVAFATFKREILAGFVAVGVAAPDDSSLKFDAEWFQGALGRRSAELLGQVEQLRIGTRDQCSQLLSVSTDGWTFNNLDSLTKLIDEKTKETKAFETQKLKYQQQKAMILQVTKLTEALEKEIERIRTETTPLRETLKADRLTKYCEYFEVLGKEQSELEKLYQPLQETLDRGTDTDRRLRFKAQFAYRLDEHLKKGLELIDRTKRGNFREVEAFRSALEALWDTYKRHSFEPAAMRESLKRLLSAFLILQTDGQGTRIELESQLRNGYTSQDFYNWFFAVNPFQIVSSLTFDDTDLYLLSPGQKGIVLLLLYLGMDRGDTRPLIIDQPEDNLDNLSVYKDLIRLFRERKQYRQIILVTHNPNLVVNTDAEQVIVASYDGKADPRITYSAGSLENQAEQIPDTPVAELTDGIIEKVCDVLEGGPRAFNQRSKVYSLSPKIH